MVMEWAMPTVRRTSKSWEDINTNYISVYITDGERQKVMLEFPITNVERLNPKLGMDRLVALIAKSGLTSLWRELASVAGFDGTWVEDFSINATVIGHGASMDWAAEYTLTTTGYWHKNDSYVYVDGEGDVQQITHTTFDHLWRSMPDHI